MSLPLILSPANRPDSPDQTTISPLPTEPCAVGDQLTMVKPALPLNEKLLCCVKAATALSVMRKNVTGPALPPACAPIEIEPMVKNAGSVQRPLLCTSSAPVPPEPPTTTAPLANSGTMKIPFACFNRF